MPVNYVDFEQAKAQQGLRMVVVPGLPSPWAEAAKGILHVKNIPWAAVRLDQRNNDMAQWTGTRSGPVAIYNNDAPLTGWREILNLAEELSTKAALLPTEPKAREQALMLCQHVCGEMGLGWTRRLNSVHSGLTGKGGFIEPIAKYLGSKYGYEADQGPEYSARVVELLNMLAQCLHEQRKAGESFYVGSQLSAVDIYSACFMAYFKPLPHEQCAMDKSMRATFEDMDESIAAALDPILIEHRDFIYGEFLELPLSL